MVPADYVRADIRPLWRNGFENRATAQTNHRLLAYATWAGSMAACAVGFKARASLPPAVRASLLLVFLAANSQVGRVDQALTGILTVLHMAPRDLALSHQLNSLVLLSAVLWLLHGVRRPNRRVLAAVLRYRASHVMRSS